MKKSAIFIALGLLLTLSAPVMSQQITDNFYVTIGSGTVLDGGGSGFNGGEWYVYPSMWINQWFYDHLFDDTRGKIIHVEFDWISVDPACSVDIEVAINWSTPAWSDLGYGNTLPPIPGELPGGVEETYIERLTVLDVCGTYNELQHFEYDYVITDYNPEWVSIDVRGCNFEITNGVLVHECAMGADNSSWGAIKTVTR